MRTPSKKATLLASLPLAILLGGCGEDEAGGENENELITTVTLTFTPAAGGTAVVARANDPDGDGGSPPTIDSITLPAGAYNLSLKFENALETPPEDITVEVKDEGDEHQVFFTGTGVSGPASNSAGAPLTQAYADMDAGGLPIGLANTITAAKGTGSLTVTLRHMPPVNDQPVKVAGTADTVKTSGISAIGGSTDVQVTFPVTVP
jgi:hypothetical protein